MKTEEQIAKNNRLAEADFGMLDLVVKPAWRDAPGTDRSTVHAAALVGQLVGFSEEGRVPLVSFGQKSAPPVPARATIDLAGAQIGSSVVMVLEDGDATRPIILGLLNATRSASANFSSDGFEANVDGEQISLSARERIVLRCGKASITLTSAGKIIIEGAYVSNRSTGVMRIKGGSVQIN